MNVKLVGSNSGSVSLQAPASTTGGAHKVLTLPDIDSTIDTTGRAGNILQVVQAYKTDTFTASITNAQESGNVTGLTPSITPTNASNKILVMWDIMTGNSVSSRIGLKLYKDDSVLTASLGDTAGSSSRVTAYSSTMQNDRHWGLSGKYLDTAGSTSSITYSVRLRIGNVASNTVSVNRPGTLYDNSGGMVAASSLILMEIAA